MITMSIVYKRRFLSVPVTRRNRRRLNVMSQYYSDSIDLDKLFDLFHCMYFTMLFPTNEFCNTVRCQQNESLELLDYIRAAVYFQTYQFKLLFT